MDQTLALSALEALDGLIDGGILVGAGGVCRAATPRASELLGLSRGTVVGSALADLIPGYEAEPTPSPGAVRTWTFRSPAGRLLECRLSSLGTDDDVIAVVAEVAGLLGGRDALLMERQRLERAQSAARIGTWELDLETMTIWGTPEAFRVYGLEPTADATMSLRQVQEIPLPEERSRLDAVLRALLETGAPYDLDFQIRRPRDGQVLTVHSRADLLRDADGRPVRVLGTVQDVSDRIEAERRAARAERLAAIGQLAGGIAHDFNNLLTAIGGYVDLIADEVPRGEQVDSDFAEVRLGLARAADLVRQLLAFAGRQRRESTTIDLGQTVQRMGPMLSRLIGEQVEVVIEDQAPGLLVMADPGQVEQVVLNLAINAHDAMPAGGRLLIRTDTADPPTAPGLASARWARLSVADTGDGIGPEAIGHIFEPFFTTKGVGRGTGMGLAVVHGIVRQSGGTIEVNSEPGAGTTFDAYFPLGERSSATTEAPTSQEPAGRGAGQNLLLAEDNSSVLSFARRTLAAAGYRVTAAADGAAALAEFEAARRPFDLLITDLAMPNLDGRRLADAGRARSPRTRVLFVSGYDPSNDLADDPEHAHFLAKPYSAESLLRAVRHVLGADAPGGDEGAGAGEVAER